MVEIIFKKEIEGITYDEKDSCNSLLIEHGGRIERKLGEDISIEVYVKNYGKIKTNEYEVNLRVLCSGKKSCSKHFFEAKGIERDFRSAVLSALKKLDVEIEHKLHLSDQGRKG